MPWDYIILCLLSLSSIVFIFLKTLKGEKRNDDDNDGGISVGKDLPDLDLPPGITLPDGPKKAKKDDNIFV